MLLPLATVLGLIGSGYVLGPAVSERHALAATIDDVYGSPNSHIMRTQPDGFGGPGRAALPRSAIVIRGITSCCLVSASGGKSLLYNP